MGKNTVNTNLKDELLLSAETSLVNYSKVSREDLRAKLVFNERNKSSVLYNIEKELGRCSDFWFSVAFINDKGLSMIKGKLKEFHRNNPSAKGKILTTKYLCFNDPDIFEELIEIDFLEVRIVDKFHSKGFFFSKIDEESGEYVNTLIVGSSNLTDSGLKYNKEWNLKLSSLGEGEIIKETDYEFNRIWNKAKKLSRKWLKEYKAEYEKNHLAEKLEDYKELKKEELKLYCSNAWPLYKLRNGEKWPENESLNYKTILQLDLYCCRMVKWSEILYIQDFMDLYQNTALHSSCNLKPGKPENSPDILDDLFLSSSISPGRKPSSSCS